VATQSEPLVFEPIGGCGGPGQPSCPPIPCIINVYGTAYALIGGVWYVLTAVTDTAKASALTALTAPPAAEEPATESTE
jgi:hypothetical protein